MCIVSLGCLRCCRQPQSTAEISCIDALDERMDGTASTCGSRFPRQTFRVSIYGNIPNRMARILVSDQ